MVWTLPTLSTEGLALLIDRCATAADISNLQTTAPIETQASGPVGMFRHDNNRPFCRYCKKNGHLIDEF